MKLLRYILILCASITVLSCKKEPKITITEKHAIQIYPSIPTKGYVASAQDETFRKDGFAVFAKKTEIEDPSKSKELMTNTKVYYDATNRWHYDGAQAYWGVNCTHDFLAVHPRQEGMEIEDSEDADTDANEIQYGPFNTIQTGTEGNNVGKDIMYGVVCGKKYHLGEIPSPIKITLYHALSAFSVSIWNASDTNIEKITNIKVAGLITNAAQLTIWRAPDIKPELKIGSTTGTYTFQETGAFLKGETTETGEKDYKSMVDPCIIIPQEFKGKTVTLTFDVKFENDANPHSYSYEISTVALNNETADLSYTYVSGKHYIYKLEITENYITCDVNVVPWIKDDVIELK